MPCQSHLARARIAASRLFSSGKSDVHSLIAELKLMVRFLPLPIGLPRYVLQSTRQFATRPKIGARNVNVGAGRKWSRF